MFSESHGQNIGDATDRKHGRHGWAGLMCRPDSEIRADPPDAVRNLGPYFCFYNGQRPHQALDYQTPEAVERYIAEHGLYHH